MIARTGIPDPPGEASRRPRSRTRKARTSPGRVEMKAWLPLRIPSRQLTQAPNLYIYWHSFRIISPITESDPVPLPFVYVRFRAS
jgi:hypothetical protein